MRFAGLLPVAAIAVVLAGCGSSNSTLTAPTIGAAQVYHLSDFTPSGPATPGQPTKVSFVIRQPNGRPLTRFATGPGPHTGVHLIMVRTDLGRIIHRHPPIAPDGTIGQTVEFPSGGKWHVLIDIYPKVTRSQPQSNFQLATTINVKGHYTPIPIGSFKPSVDVGGYRFTIHNMPKIKALEPAFLDVTVDKGDKKADFTPWYGALAHAVFFQVGTLNYFHTHVCSSGTAGCTSILGGAKVTGASTTPGKLSVGVLLPVAGTWKLFLQTKIDGHVLTAPYTIKAS